MSDATGSAVAALGGNDNAAAAPAAVATPTTPTAADPAAWYSDSPPELKGLVEKKGWKNSADALKSYAELERAFSGDKIVLPKDAGDEAAWGNLYDKLGRPKTAADYKFPEGVDAEQVRALAPELHKIGVTQAQAEALAKLDIARATQANEAFVAASQADQKGGNVQNLRPKWGANLPANIEINRRAMRALGLSVEDASKYMAAGGTEKFMRLLNLAGSAMKEDNTADLGNDQNLGFGMTANRAAAELQRLKNDPLWVARWRGGDKGAKATYDRLIQIQAGVA